MILATKTEVDEARRALAEYEQVLTTWGAGPDNTAPSTIGQEQR